MYTIGITWAGEQIFVALLGFQKCAFSAAQFYLPKLLDQLLTREAADKKAKARSYSSTPLVKIYFIVRWGLILNTMGIDTT